MLSVVCRHVGVCVCIYMQIHGRPSSYIHGVVRSRAYVYLHNYESSVCACARDILSPMTGTRKQQQILRFQFCGARVRAEKEDNDVASFQKEKKKTRDKPSVSGGMETARNAKLNHRNKTNFIVTTGFCKNQCKQSRRKRRDYSAPLK